MPDLPKGAILRSKHNPENPLGSTCYSKSTNTKATWACAEPLSPTNGQIRITASPWESSPTSRLSAGTQGFTPNGTTDRVQNIHNTTERRVVRVLFRCDALSLSLTNCVNKSLARFHPNCNAERLHHPPGTSLTQHLGEQGRGNVAPLLRSPLDLDTSEFGTVISAISAGVARQGPASLGPPSKEHPRKRTSFRSHGRSKTQTGHQDVVLSASLRARKSLL